MSFVSGMNQAGRRRATAGKTPKLAKRFSFSHFIILFVRGHPEYFKS